MEEITGKDIKIVALVPTRGDRPKMLENMKRLMTNQTQQLHGLVIFDDEPIYPKKKDITYRYRMGLQRVFDLYPDCDLVAIVEDDDWYSPVYIETMAQAWLDEGRPDLFGVGFTDYYHLKVRGRYREFHPDRASGFCTFMTRKVVQVNSWPKDDYPFVDMHLWQKVNVRKRAVGSIDECLFYPIALGIKGHNEGALFGGSCHSDMRVYSNQAGDNNFEWFKNTVDEESFKFYESL